MFKRLVRISLIHNNLTADSIKQLEDYKIAHPNV
jgi:hypothetical protein